MQSIHHQLGGAVGRRDRRRPRALLSALVILAGLLGADVAWAEDSGADSLFREGVRALRAGRYEDAASFFRLSYQMEPRASTMCNLALTYERAGQDQQALESYRRCAEDDTSGRYRDHALERARDIESRLGARPEPLALRNQQPPPQQVRTSQQAPTAYQQQPPTQQPEPQRTRRTHPLAWAGLGVTLLGLGTLGGGVGLHVWSNGVYDDLVAEYDTQIPEDSAAEDRMNRGANGASAALALYIVGGLISGIGTLLMLLDIGGVGSRQVVQYSVAPSRDGLSVALAFNFF